MNRSTPPAPAGERESQAVHTRAHRARRDAAALDVRGFKLTVVEGPRSGATWESATDRASLGSHPSNDFVLDDSTVSRFHCELAMTAEGPRVRDLGSLNGTILDGVQIKDAFVRADSHIRLGASVVRFQFRAEANKVVLSTATRFGSMLGSSPSMRATFALLERAAKSSSTVLLEGETGTGKGRAAAALHAASARKDGPFLTLDCSSIPPNLLESELFGHEKGAFTGAVGQRIGVFESAEGGTVFLDEIGEMPLELQPKLLRVLEDREVRRVGSSAARAVDVRVVAATNRDLRAEVNAGRFRSDLFFRLAVLRIPLPPLRERPEDIPPLVDALLEALGAGPEDGAPLRSPEFVAKLQGASWPGNVRELRNVIERCLVFQEARLDAVEGAPAAAAPVGDAAPAVDASLPFVEARDRAMERFERAYLEALLARHDGKVTTAAKAAGIGRVYLHKLLRRHRVTST